MTGKSSWFKKKSDEDEDEGQGSTVKTGLGSLRPTKAKLDTTAKKTAGGQKKDNREAEGVMKGA